MLLRGRPCRKFASIPNFLGRRRVEKLVAIKYLSCPVMLELDHHTQNELVGGCARE